MNVVLFMGIPVLVTCSGFVRDLNLAKAIPQTVVIQLPNTDVYKLEPRFKYEWSCRRISLSSHILIHSIGQLANSSVECPRLHRPHNTKPFWRTFNASSEEPNRGGLDGFVIYWGEIRPPKLTKLRLHVGAEGVTNTGPFIIISV
jgi:hypothetical protein